MIAWCLATATIYNVTSFCSPWSDTESVQKSKAEGDLSVTHHHQQQIPAKDSPVERPHAKLCMCNVRSPISLFSKLNWMKGRVLNLEKKEIRLHTFCCSGVANLICHYLYPEIYSHTNLTHSPKLVLEVHFSLLYFWAWLNRMVRLLYAHSLGNCLLFLHYNASP